MKYPKLVVDQFEDYAYRHYKAARMSQALLGIKLVAELSRDQYLEREGDSYKNASTSVLWTGWKLCLDSQAPMLEAANLWRQWAEIQERAARELPEHYEIQWSIDKEREGVDGSGLVSMQVVHWPDGVYIEDAECIEFPDPEDQTTPGLFVRMFDSALQAAKDHHAMGMI